MFYSLVRQALAWSIKPAKVLQLDANQGDQQTQPQQRNRNQRQPEELQKPKPPSRFKNITSILKSSHREDDEDGISTSAGRDGGQTDRSVLPLINVTTPVNDENGSSNNNRSVNQRHTAPPLTPAPVYVNLG